MPTPEQKRVAGNLNVSFSGLDGLSLLPAMSELAVSTSSACASALMEGSYVLRALGVSRELALNSVRLSVGRYTTDADVEIAINVIHQAITRLKVK